jgi:hypothetical protein
MKGGDIHNAGQTKGDIDAEEPAGSLVIRSRGFSLKEREA